jgi:rod shape-determining protein MreC
LASQKFWILKPWLILGVFLLVWWIIPVIVKSFTQVGLYELQAPLSKASGKISDLQEYWSLRNHSKKELIEVIRDLARLNASYELSLSENNALKEELNRMEKLLNLPRLPEYQHVLARVIRRELSSWSHQIIIHKGLKDGIINGAAVIYDKGVVGRIRETFAHTSVVELASSPTFRIAAKFEGDNRPITYQGISNPAFMDPFGETSNIPTDIKTSPDKPLHLVSSKLGGIFPDGLSIGTVKNLRPGTDGMFNCGKVYLDPNLHAIKEVAVLLPLNRTIENDK